VILEYSFNQLMQQIWREKFMYIGSGKGVREWLKNVSTNKY
jgi:hypothetical protein